MKFKIRKIQKSDVKGFHAALSSVVRERKFLLTVQAPVIEDAQKYVCKNVDNNHAQYVVDIDGEIVGWADIIPHSKEVLCHSGVLGIGIVAECRGKGIGKVLLKRVIDHAWKNGLTRLELEVFADNINAIALYERFGFELEGTKRNARLLDGLYRDVHIMAQCRC